MLMWISVVVALLNSLAGLIKSEQLKSLTIPNSRTHLRSHIFESRNQGSK